MARHRQFPHTIPWWALWRAVDVTEHGSQPNWPHQLQPTYGLANNRNTPEVLLHPLIISRNESERVLIEPSINSIRVSISIKQADDIEKILCHKFTRFMMMRAENFVILRRTVVPSTGELWRIRIPS